MNFQLLPGDRLVERDLCDRGPIMVNWPFSKRSDNGLVVSKENRRSVQ